MEEAEGKSAGQDRAVSKHVLGQWSNDGRLDGVQVSQIILL